MGEKSKFNLGNILWYLVFGIGYIILYLDFFSPSEWGKKRNVSTTGRRFRAKHLWGPIYSIVIYFIIAMFMMSGAS